MLSHREGRMTKPLGFYVRILTSREGEQTSFPYLQSVCYIDRYMQCPILQFLFTWPGNAHFLFDLKWPAHIQSESTTNYARILIFSEMNHRK